MAISDEQAEVNLRAAFGPELKKACATACEEITQDYTPELAKKMANNIEEVMISNVEDFKRTLNK